MVPNAIDFSKVVLGQTNSQTVKMTNETTSDLRVDKIQVSGSAFSISRVTFPFTLAPKSNRTFNVEFSPKKLGTFSGNLTIGSNLADSPVVSVKGIGTNSLLKLQSTPASINFGNLKIKGSAAQKVVLTNIGNATLTVDQVVLSGTGFKLSELASHFQLAPQQETSVMVSFNPQVKGVTNGSLKFVSKDLSTPLAVSLTGNAVDGTTTPATSSHTVKLAWGASPGNISGYYVYRGAESGGPYNLLTGSLVSALQYVDSSVEPGEQYFYVVASVNNSGNESKYSDEVSVVIPKP
jgi:hypothetical protein